MLVRPCTLARARNCASLSARSGPASSLASLHAPRNSLAVSSPDVSIDVGQLSDDELDELADLLERHADTHIDAALGLMNAVVVAPGAVSPTLWVAQLVPESAFESEAVGKKLVGLLLRLHNEVRMLLEQGEVWMPGPEEAEAIELFATGYVAGAELDPRWVGDADRWALVAPFAYLAGRHDLVPADTLKMFGESDEGLALVRQQVGALVLQTYSAFLPLRSAPAKAAPRIGRNDPCPCGSGKKHKKCCGRQ